MNKEAMFFRDEGEMGGCAQRSKKGFKRDKSS